MTSSLSDAAIAHLAKTSALRALARERHLLERILEEPDPAALLTAQLVPGQFDCAGQLRTVTIFALRSVLPLIGRDWSLAAKGANADALSQQMAGAAAEITALRPDDFDGVAKRRIAHRAGDADLNQSADDYLILFALPNLWFHLSSAYAILRQAGVDVGKEDFDGLHRYSPGFSFVS